MERIAVIGAGNVGGVVGRTWAQKGHRVRFGVPDPSSPKYSAQPASGDIAFTTVADAAAGATVVVLATPWPATEAALKAAGDLSGKIVIDCTNPLGMGTDGLGLTLGFSTSGGEMVADWARGALVFKSLNQTGFANMADVTYPAGKAVMFVAGDDENAKPRVLALIGDLGFEAVDAGPLKASRLLEPFGMLWIDLALKRGQGRDFAFGILRRPA